MISPNINSNRYNIKEKSNLKVGKSTKIEPNVKPIIVEKVGI